MSNKSWTVVKIIVISLLSIGLTILFTIIINDAVFKHTEGLVYRTETGNRYHSPGCGYLWNSAIPMGYEQAKASSLKVCSRCGSSPKGTIEVNDFGTSFCIILIAVAAITLLVLWIKSLTHKENTSTAPTTFKCVPNTSVEAPKNLGSSRPQNNPHLDRPLHQPPQTIPRENSTLIQPKPRLSLPQNGFWGIPIVDEYEKSPNDPNIEIKNNLREYPLELIRRIIGLRLTHKKYGNGTIVDISKKYIWVQFDDFEKIKTFVYPDGIVDGYLIPIKRL
ncbi:MAG: hypothetical protein IJY11_03260 [Clostridia bacterium]|nr:hypothetical protein [Clostridia bacterium]